MEQNETFKMTYSTQQQEEVEAIRKKYTAPEENKMARLRALDAGASKKAASRAITVGVVGTLVMGAGMSLVMSEFGEIAGRLAVPLGIALGLIGIAVLACAYPLYHRVLEKERKKIAPEILRLTDELLHG